MDQNGALKGHEQIYCGLLQQLGREDLKKRAAIKDLPLQADGKVVVTSFARNYLVSDDGVSVFDSEPLSFQQKLAVVSYLLSSGAGEPALEFVNFEQLGGLNIGRERHADKGLKQPILAKFGENYELFAKAARKIGGVPKHSDTAGTNLWLFHAFPKLPISVTYYEADEEFSADVRVLFDAKALDFIGLRCLGFLPGYFTGTLLEAAADLLGR